MIERLESLPKYDAILAHGYWMSEPKKGDVRLSLRSRLSARAAAFAYDHGNGAKKLIVDLGHLWGPNYPSEGSLMAKELELRGVPTEDIIFKESAFSTGGEVKSAIKLARENNWKRILDVGFYEHQRSIPAIYKEFKGADLAELRSVEKIIGEMDNRHVISLVNKLSKSRYGITYKYIYELLKRTRMRSPGFSYDKFEQENRNNRQDKSHDSPLPWPLRFDVYKL